MLAEQPLVSIIIPTFNRAHLIGETLDSVLAQTYTNWECIIVDDGSTDDTDTVMAQYVQVDSRFRYYKRPDVHLPGGSGARNYGFNLSKGEYIQWFDSDDLMVPEKLLVKIKIIETYVVDFVISQTQYFNREKGGIYSYNYKEEEVDFISYATTHISWFTPDIFLKRSIAKRINFNENLRSGQEYNFSCKLLLETSSMKKIDKVLTLRRYHINSIGFKRRDNNLYYLKSRLNTYWINYNEIIQLTRNKHFEKFTILVCVSAYFQSRKQIGLPKGFNSAVLKTFGWKSIYFYFAMLTNYWSGKYHFFYNQLK